MSSVAELKCIFDEYIAMCNQRLKTFNEFVKTEHRFVESVIDVQLRTLDSAKISDEYNMIVKKTVDLELRLFAAIVNLPDDI